MIMWVFHWAIKKQNYIQMKTIRDAKTFDELLDIKYGKPGTEKRDEFKLKPNRLSLGR